MEPLVSTDLSLLQQNETQRILCCQCGIVIEPNSANMCVACLRSQVDITEGIPKQSTIYFCRSCERYLQPPATWVSCVLESRELLTLCLKRLRGLNKVHLVDAGFVWTEPHSKRLKVKLVVQKEVLTSTLLQQIFIVEYIVHNQMCDDCQRREAKDYWRSIVQVRQKINHKKTFLYLEQVILKHHAHQNVLRIKETKDGLDFFYAQKQDARKLVDFMMGVVPCRYKTSQELISHDTHTNVFNYKHTFSLEIVPICKDNIVCLPKKLAQSLGNISSVVLCTKVANFLQVMDPTTLQVADIPANVFWRSPFSSLFDHRQLSEFLVLQLEVVTGALLGHNTSNRCVLADVWVSPLAEMDRQIHCRTHLGHILNPGDTVWGVDFTQANLNNEHFDKLKHHEIPDVLLVKKGYGDSKKRHKHRNWQLQTIHKEPEGMMEEEDDDQRDYLDFLEDLEEDPNYRQGVNIFMKPNVVPEMPDDDSDIAPDVPRIGVEEMLQNLSISDPLLNSN